MGFVLLALLTMWVLHLRQLAQEMIWHSSDVDCFDSRTDLTSVCSGSERLDTPVKKTVKRHVLVLSIRYTDVPPRCAGGLRSSNMVVCRRRFQTTYRSHLQGPSSPTTNTLRAKSLKTRL